MTAPSSQRSITIECLRFNPETDAEPHFDRWNVPFSDDMSVLQGLQYIKDHLDGSLSFRWSCRMAICGSCGHMVNGEPVLSCHTFLRHYHPGPVRVEPLQHFPILRDLVIDQTGFLDKLEAVKPYLIPHTQQPLSDGAHRQTPEQMAHYYAQAQCINCLLCYAACPQYGLDPEFTGPAALALLHRYNADSRDAGWPARRDVVNSEQGVWGCTLVGSCSRVCPKGVDPAHAINQNKVTSALDYLGILQLLAPRGADR
jgi:fumarate reductase iron-sulfur subunit